MFDRSLGPLASLFIVAFQFVFLTVFLTLFITAVDEHQFLDIVLRQRKLLSFADLRASAAAVYHPLTCRFLGLL